LHDLSIIWILYTAPAKSEELVISADQLRHKVAP
jgi:hypothetical protein